MFRSHCRILHKIPKPIYKMQQHYMKSQKVPTIYTQGALAQNTMHTKLTAD